MAGAKILVMYPMPKDVAAFDKIYTEEHIPIAAPIFASAGATKAVLTSVKGSPRFTFRAWLI